MTAGQWGQLLVILSPILFLLYRKGRPFYVRLRLRRLIRKWNRYIRDRDHAIALVYDKEWERRNGKAQLVRAIRSDLERGTKWQQNARKAEGLGFIDPTDGGWAA